LTFGFSSSEDESDDESEELLSDEGLAATLALFAFGVSLSELESDDEDESLVEDAFRFKEFVLDLDEAGLVDRISFSSSASLSELLDESEEEEDEEADFRLDAFLAGGGASFISTSLESLSELLLSLLLDCATWALTCFAFSAFIFLASFTFVDFLKLLSSASTIAGVVFFEATHSSKMVVSGGVSKEP
jgi:hypothetical protein